MTRLEVFIKQLTPRFYLTFVGIVLLYILFQVYLFNFRLINGTIIGDFPISYKAVLLFQLSKGIFTAFPQQQLLFTFVTALLTGLNLTLIVHAYRKMKSQEGKVTLSFGGMGALSLAASGCPSCGITILSLLGPASSSFSFFLNNIFVQMGIVLLLCISIAYSIKNITESTLCKVPLNGHVQGE